MSAPIDRRRFLQTTAALGAAAAGLSLSAEKRDPAPANPAPGPDPAAMLGPTRNPRPYPEDRPRVILIRFGGGVRRQETIADPDRTWCPFIYHELYRNRGVLLNNVVMDDGPDVVTSHAEGTLYLLTGKYELHRDSAFRTRYEARVPTLFEYLRAEYGAEHVPAHQALIINGEDRIDEEFFTFSNTPHYGVRYRSTVLSLYRFKTFVLRDELAHGKWTHRGRTPLTDHERQTKQQQLNQMQNLGERVADLNVPSPEIDRFWERWREHYGTSGYVNPRGDRLLTTLALWALRHLRPRLMMINYQDSDYVHWGNRNFYTRALAVIDDGVRELYSAVQADAEYRGRTVFLVVPDCGRDSNPSMPIPYQHHFNTRSAREIFAIAAGPGVVRSRTPVDRRTQQIGVTASVGQLMGFEQPLRRFVDAGPLEIHT
jgi:hypothetical protein